MELVVRKWSSDRLLWWRPPDALWTHKKSAAEYRIIYFDGGLGGKMLWSELLPL